MASQAFSDLYISDCENCGEELEWEWMDDDLVFQATCPCGCSYQLEPTAGNLTTEATISDDDEDNYDDDC